MIVYKKDWLSNLLLLDGVNKDYEAGLISDNEWSNIRSKYSHGYYVPNYFIRVGLFLLTVVTCLFSSGFLSILFAGAGFIDSAGWALFLAIIHYIALELIAQEKLHFRSGVDDALILIFMALITGSFVMATKANETPLLLSIFILGISAFLAVRFINAIMALVCYLSGIAVVFFCWKELIWGNLTMPFILIAFSGFIYWLVKKYQPNPRFTFYQASISVVLVASLLSMYASGNYFAVNELSGVLGGNTSKSIPLGWFFWAWTICLPVVYIFFGLKQKNVILLRTGLLLIAAAAATYKAYYKLMPLELTLVLCGFLAILLSCFLFSFFKTPKFGFTFKRLQGGGVMGELKVESLIVAGSFAEAEMLPAEPAQKFGGGHFGGAGAEGKY